MSLAPWRSPLARALHRNRSQPFSRYAQLATVRSDGRPANRTVVFREFVPNSNSLVFVTDRRSEKVIQLRENPAAELCWYFTQTREQFRLSGNVQIHDAALSQTAQDLRAQTWQALSENARQQFAWPHPGKPRQDEGFEPKSLDAVTPLDTFVVLGLAPDFVDHLELRGEPQNRYQYRLVDTTWEQVVLNP